MSLEELPTKGDRLSLVQFRRAVVGVEAVDLPRKTTSTMLCSRQERPAPHQRVLQMQTDQRDWRFPALLQAHPLAAGLQAQTVSVSPPASAFGEHYLGQRRTE